MTEQRAVTDETLDGLHEMAGTVAVKGPLLRQIIDELRALRALSTELAEAKAEIERIKDEMAARCDRAYCDGADAALCIGPSGDDPASAKKRLEAIAEWKASGYGGRRSASRAALIPAKGKGE